MYIIKNPIRVFFFSGINPIWSIQHLINEEIHPEVVDWITEGSFNAVNICEGSSQQGNKSKHVYYVVSNNITQTRNTFNGIKQRSKANSMVQIPDLVKAKS